MSLRILFADMNSFFASVEQQFRPNLRNRPVAVVAVDVGSTCCIAVSQEAKDLGIRRGMPVWQAKKCKSLSVVEANPALYVKTHQDIL
jgi:DNA polymerase IV